uniref:Uncharacterized protein n=1 Tax=Rhizophora mucronata TaxID=61149 RepID=A0A2P2PSE3_RHIMU
MPMKRHFGEESTEIAMTIWSKSTKPKTHSRFFKVKKQI